MSRQRAPHPTIMERVGGRRAPNHVPDYRNGRFHVLPAAEKECGYCRQSFGRTDLTRLPNGLFICPNHPSAEERDKMGIIEG